MATGVAAPLDGAAVRRWTRRATAARAQTTLGERLSDAWGGLVTAGIGVAVAGGSLASLRERIALAGAPVTGTTLPAPLTSAALALVALACVVVVLARLGPVSATPAAAAWWLPLPADRRGLLRGELLRLTPKEFKLLETLIKQPGRAWSRLDLLEQVFGFDYEGLERTVDAHVANLRRKIEHDPAQPEYIQTVYGVGYKFAEDDDGA